MTWVSSNKTPPRAEEHQYNKLRSKQEKVGGSKKYVGMFYSDRAHLNNTCFCWRRFTAAFSSKKSVKTKWLPPSLCCCWPLCVCFTLGFSGYYNIAIYLGGCQNPEQSVNDLFMFMTGTLLTFNIHSEPVFRQDPTCILIFCMQGEGWGTGTVPFICVYIWYMHIIFKYYIDNVMYIYIYTMGCRNHEK